MAGHPSGMIDDLQLRLNEHLAARCAGYRDAEMLSTTGGSAVVFRVSTPTGSRAIKAFLPDLFTGTRSVAERRRLNLQRTLIGHDCRASRSMRMTASRSMHTKQPVSCAS